MPKPAEEKHLRTQMEELRKKYDTLSKRIAALDTDISRALDGVTKQVSEEKRAELEAERSGVVAEIDRLGTSINRDLDTAREGVHEPHQATVSNEHDGLVAGARQIDSRVVSSHGTIPRRPFQESAKGEANAFREALLGRADYILLLAANPSTTTRTSSTSAAMAARPANCSWRTTKAASSPCRRTP